MTKESQNETMKITTQEVLPGFIRFISGANNYCGCINAFGPGSFFKNVASMRQIHTNLGGEQIKFRTPSTIESLYLASYDLKNKTKPEILDKGGYNGHSLGRGSWLHLGLITISSEGIYANVPDDPNNKLTEEKLKKLLDKCEKFHGVYLGEKGFGFVPYDSFRTGNFGSAKEFASGGLARLLEGAKNETAEMLKIMSSDWDYKQGICVAKFETINEPVTKIVGIRSRRFGGPNDPLGFTNHGFGADVHDGFEVNGNLNIDGKDITPPSGHIDTSEGYMFGVIENE